MSSGRKFLDLDEDSFKCNLFSVTVLESPADTNTVQQSILQGLGDDFDDFTHSTAKPPWLCDHEAKVSQCELDNYSVRSNGQINTNGSRFSVSGDEEERVNVTETPGLVNRGDCYWESGENGRMASKQKEGGAFVGVQRLGNGSPTNSVIKDKAAVQGSGISSSEEEKNGPIEFQLINNTSSGKQYNSEMSDNHTGCISHCSMSSSSQDVDKVFTGKLGNSNNYSDAVISGLEHGSNLSERGNENLPFDFNSQIIQAASLYADRLSRTVINESVTERREDQLDKESSSSLPKETSFSSASASCGDREDRENKEIPSTWWHSHLATRPQGCHDNSDSSGKIDFPLYSRSCNNHQELLLSQKQSVLPDNDICATGGAFTEGRALGNDINDFNVTEEFEDPSVTSEQNTVSNDNRESPLLMEYHNEICSDHKHNGFSENVTNLDNLHITTKVEIAGETETTQEIIPVVGASYKRCFESLDLDPYAPAGLSDVDPFGEPFGLGDPFAIQSPDPFDADPFNLPGEHIRQVTVSSQENVFCSPLKSVGNGSLYKIIEETEDKSHIQALNSEHMLLDSCSPDIHDNSLVVNICDSQSSKFKEKDHLKGGQTNSKDLNSVSTKEFWAATNTFLHKHNCDRKIYESEMEEEMITNEAKELVDMVISQALDEISRQLPLQKKVVFSLSDISGSSDMASCTKARNKKPKSSGEQGDKSSTSGNTGKALDFSLDCFRDISIKRGDIHVNAESGSQDDCEPQSFCPLPDKEDGVSSHTEHFNRDMLNDLRQTLTTPQSVAISTGDDNNKNASSHIVKYSKQILSKALAASLVDVAMYYSSGHANSGGIQSEMVSPRKANGEMQHSQSPLQQGIETNLQSLDSHVSHNSTVRPAFLTNSAFSVSIEIEECSSPEGSCGCIPPPQITIDECATPMDSEDGDFYSMFNGVSNSEISLENHEAAPEEFEEDKETNGGNVDNSSIVSDIDQISDNDQVSSLEGDDDDSDNHKHFSNYQDMEDLIETSRGISNSRFCSETPYHTGVAGIDCSQFRGGSLDNTKPPCVQIDECSSPDSSLDEWHDVYARSQACQVPVINIQGCSSREPSSDEESDTLRHARKTAKSKKVKNQSSSNHVDLQMVEKFIDHVVKSAVDTIESNMGTEKYLSQDSDGAAERSGKPDEGAEGTPYTVDDVDSYSEEIKQLHDQIPEELSMPLNSLQKHGSSQDQNTRNPFSDYDNSNTVPSVHNSSAYSSHYDTNSMENLLEHSVRRTDSQDSLQNLGAEDYDEDIMDNNVHDMAGVNDVIKRELSLAEELSQSMHEELNSTDLDLNVVEVCLESPSVPETMPVDAIASGVGGVPVVPETSESVYDRIIDKVLTCTSRKPAAKPGDHPSEVSSSPKRKIFPMLDLLSPDEELDPRAESRLSSSSDTDYSLCSRTPDDTPEVHRLPSCGSNSAVSSKHIPEYSAREEFENNRNWRSVKIGDKILKIDMRVIEPYKKVLSHGGYYGDGFNAIIVFAACHLPDKRRRDYQYVMDNLFLYVVSTLELLVVEDYMIVYFHGATPRNKMPGLRWLKQCYEMVERKLKKNLKKLLIVHPTLWLKTVVMMTKPFVSSKFYQKIEYVKSLLQLTELVPTEYIFVPDEIQQVEKRSFKVQPKKKFINL